MAMIKCDKGIHLYEESQHSSCPFCGVQLSSEGTRPLDFGRPRFDSTGPSESDPLRAGSPDRARAASGNVEETIKKTSPGPGAPRGESVQDSATIGVWPKADPGARGERFSPVTGWLVCIQGTARGRDFRLHPEGNFIGRSVDNDVVIPNDAAISREKHAMIFYDLQDRSFVLTRGERARGSVRLNGKNVFQPCQLRPHDVIVIGETELLFIPFCSEKFDWISDARPGPVKDEADA